MGVLPLPAGRCPACTTCSVRGSTSRPARCGTGPSAPANCSIARAGSRRTRRDDGGALGSPVPPHSNWLPELTIAAEYAHRSSDHELGKVIARCIEPFVHQHAVFGVTLSLGSMWRPYALALAAAGDEHGAREAMATARLVNAGAGLALWERLSRFD